MPVIPGWLRALGRALMRVLRVIGHVQAWIILTVFYLVLVVPVALIFRLRADPLHLRRREGSAWTPRPALPKDRMAWARQQ